MQKGDRIKEYVLDRMLGEGGMGRVFLAERVGMGGFRTKVVLKVLLNEHAFLRDYFSTEAKIGGYFNHNNVVRILDFFEQDGRSFMVQGVSTLQN